MMFLKGTIFLGKPHLGGRAGSAGCQPTPGAGQELLSCHFTPEASTARLVTLTRHPGAETGPGAHQEVTDPAALTQLHVTVTASGTGHISRATAVLSTTLLSSGAHSSTA